jgi:hypothetical protein
MSTIWFWISLLALIGGITAEGTAEQKKFSDILSVIVEKREDLSQHQLFKFMGDASLPYEKRLSFIPYFIYFSMTFADMCDTWMYIPNPQTELERRLNTFISEDNFHYNLFMHDLTALGYTMERFGSLHGVLRHIWGDDSKAIRQLMYTWVLTAKKYDDPLISLVTIESFEAGLKDFFEIPFFNIHMPDDGLKYLQYFGIKHVELEQNHSQTAWFKAGENPMDTRPLGKFDVSETQWMQAMEVVENIFDRYVWTFILM